jgi:malate dehydrogenase (oxaloacetate-decarboxylating)(NADP+)
VDDGVEMARARAALKACGSSFEAYKQLVALQLTDEKTFYQLLRDDPETLLPILYTPTVGEACLKFGTLVQRPLGMWVSLDDAGSVKRLVQNWPSNNVKIAVITDGERILGLGDQGANGMGISAGKSMVYAACGIPPSTLLPIQIDTGTNNKILLDDPLYIGLKQPRDRTKAYDAIVDEVVSAVRDRYGAQTIIHWEDFAPRNAFRLLRKFQAVPGVVTYNDDIQGTAAVTVSGLLASVRALSKGAITTQRVLFFGAGQANCGAAELFVRALMKRGVSAEEARKRIWLFDSKGLVTKSRSATLSSDKLPFAQDAPEISDLLGAVEFVKPTALVGAAAVPGAFTENVVTKMSELNAQPIIFALSNPTSKAECTAEQAYTWSKGSAIFASGTRFAPVTYAGKTFAPGFANNAFIFPAIALGAIVSGAERVTPSMFLAAAESLAQSVDDSLLRIGAVYPPVDRIASSAVDVAADVAADADPSLSARAHRARIVEYVRAHA